MQLAVDRGADSVGASTRAASFGHSMSVQDAKTTAKRVRSDSVGHQEQAPRFGLRPERGAGTPSGGPPERPFTLMLALRSEEGKAAMPAPLSTEARTRIISALTEGNSIRATARMVNVHRDTVMDLGLRVGEGCARLHNRLVRDVAAHVLECDEEWSWVHTKNARVKATDPQEWGDAYSYLALDATSRLIVSWHVGKRDDANTRIFIDDLRARLTVMPHISTDGWVPYIDAVAAAFQGACDFGRVVKRYRGGVQRSPDHRYEPARDPFITRTPVIGSPVEALMSTSLVERVNGTLRHVVGRKRRLCLAFSKTLRGHRAAVALGIMAYNYVRLHATIGTAPAVAARLTQAPWTIAHLVDAALAEVETDAPRAKALTPRPGSAPVRQTERGTWLRLVSSGSPARPTPAPGPTPAAPAPTLTEVPRPARQLSLFPDLENP